ncbi:MAG: hypothetical protein RL026_1236 [Pseudomonadota bacterium]|jgi:RsiW-degrading membrane proteinase PrsW (M82 family)
MDAALFLNGALGLLPVLAYLLALVWFDSYKLAPLRQLWPVLLAGVLTAVVCYHLNGVLLGHSDLALRDYSRWVAPFVEESVKATVVLWLFRTHRIGFVGDAALYGFAAGAGFALFENLLYLSQPGFGVVVWIVRGFGTAFMHGGTVALFAVLLLALDERSGRAGWRHGLPALLLAGLIHAGFNHFVLKPLLQALLTVLVLVPLLHGVFRHAERKVAAWLGSGLDSGMEILHLIHTGRLTDSPIGRYFHEIRERFSGEVAIDAICYLRLHTELGLRAKGMLLMREEGFDLPLDEETRRKLAELGHLERSIGKTGLAALAPLLGQSRKDLWHLRTLLR